MAKFRLITDPKKEYIDQAWIFNDEYFTIDTAERRLVDTWYAKNAKNIIYALQGEEVIGFFTVIPLTEECGKRFERNAITEEEIHADDILSPDAMPYAQYLYVAAIAVKDHRSIIGRHAIAALIAGLCDRITTLYDLAYLKHMFVNPTTFYGNRFIRRLGLEKIQNVKRSLRAGNDIYTMPFRPETFDMLRNLDKRYTRFVASREWSE